LKNKVTELDVDFIGGQGSLTKDEERQISEFIKAQKKLSGMEKISFNEWINDRIFEMDNAIESYEKYAKSQEETISINTHKFLSMDEVDERQKEIAEARLSIYRNVIKYILMPTKNNYLSILKSYEEDED